MATKYGTERKSYFGMIHSPILMISLLAALILTINMFLRISSITAFQHHT